MSFWRSLFHMSIQSKLPRLKRTLINPRDRQPIEDDAHRLMMAGLARDEYAALDLVKHHKLPLVDLIRLLAKPRKANWRKRLMNRLRGLEGSWDHNPHGPELRALKRGERTGRNNWM
jgi:hypothetical protein